MSDVAPPATTWIGGQDQEYTQTGNPNLETENSFDLITEAGDSLVLEDLAVVQLPATTWSVNDGD